MDKIVQGNTNNIIFLKSTDDSMLETLQKMSGTTHKVYKDVKTFTRDNEQLFNKAEGKISYTMTAKEVPVVSYNDMAFIGERNSIVFRAGDPPCWNRNETILPMSWRLFQNTIKIPGRKFTLQTVPTLSNSLDFDVRKNTPDFMKMLAERLDQARESPGAMKAYQLAHGYSDYDVAQLDPDVYSDDVMEVIDQVLYQAEQSAAESASADDLEEAMAALANEEDGQEDPEQFFGQKMLDQREQALEQKSRELWSKAKTDENVMAEAAKHKAELDDWQLRRYAQGRLSRDELLPKVHSDTGMCSMSIKNILVKAWMECKSRWNADRDGVRIGVGANGRDVFYGPGDTVFVEWRGGLSEDARLMNEALEDEYSSVYGEERIREGDLSVENQMHMRDDCVRWLASLDSWRDLAEGEFDRAVARYMET